MKGARAFLADMFDAPYNYKRKLQSQIYEIDHPAPCIFSGTNPKWFIENLKESDVEGGLLPRFIIIPNARKGSMLARPPMADKDKRRRMIEWMKEIEAVKGAAYWTQEACDIHDEWYRKVWNMGYSGAMVPFIGRLQSYVIKFSMIVEINNSLSLKVQRSSMIDACHLADWLRHRLEEIEKEEIVFGRTNKDCQKIRKILKNGESLRADLLRNTHLSKWEFNRAIETMVDRNEVSEGKRLSEGAKKPGIWYKLI